MLWKFYSLLLGERELCVMLLLHGPKFFSYELCASFDGGIRGWFNYRVCFEDDEVKHFSD
jgi:hypothetical protein